MAANNEKRIVCKIIESKDASPLLDREIGPDWFVNEKHRQALEFILNYLDKYGTVPDRVTFETQMGSSYGLVSVSAPLEYLLDEQAKGRQWEAAQKMLPSVEDALDKSQDDPSEAIREIETALARIRSYSTDSNNRLVDLMSKQRLDEQWDDYERREKGGGLLGYSTGFPTIDKTTLGFQPGQLITVVAQPKVGKTSICLSIANHVYTEYEAPILFVSFEMGAREIELRQSSMMARINFRNLQSGKLTPLEKKRYAKHLDHAEEHYSWPFHFMDAGKGSTVGAVRSQLERLDPALVVIDGIYMMTDEDTGEKNTPQALTGITRALKRLATQTQKPFLINSQALAWKSKGNRITSDSTGYSSSFHQDSDVLLGLERVTPPKGEEEAESYSYQRILKVLDGRNIGRVSVDLDFDYDEGRIEEAP